MATHTSKSFPFFFKHSFVLLLNTNSYATKHPSIQIKQALRQFAGLKVFLFLFRMLQKPDFFDMRKFFSFSIVWKIYYMPFWIDIKESGISYDGDDWPWGWFLIFPCIAVLENCLWVVDSWWKNCWFMEIIDDRIWMGSDRMFWDFYAVFVIRCFMECSSEMKKLKV